MLSVGTSIGFVICYPLLKKEGDDFHRLPNGGLFMEVH